MNKDQVKGRVEEAKGKAKEVSGVLLDDKKMEIEGNIQKNIGKGQSAWGDLKHEIEKNNWNEHRCGQADGLTPCGRSPCGYPYGSKRGSKRESQRLRSGMALNFGMAGCIDIWRSSSFEISDWRKSHA